MGIARGLALGALALAIGCLDSTEPITFTPLPFDVDRDQDGVADADDNCPDRANAIDASGEQPPVCGRELAAVIDRYVFLDSRTFEPPTGLDPELVLDGGRPQVLLHVRRGDGPRILDKWQRATLEAAGVELFDYVPHRTYVARVPGHQRALETIARLSFVRGVSAVVPSDKIATRIRGTRSSLSGPGADGLHRFVVEFLDGATPEEIEAAVSAAGGRVEVLDETEVHVAIEVAGLAALAADPAVLWVDDLTRSGTTDVLSNEVTKADLAETVLGLGGAGMTVAMSDLYLAEQGHPDLGNRIIQEGTGREAENNEERHALEVASIMAGDGSIDPAGATRGVVPRAQVVSWAIKYAVPGGEWFKTNRKKGYGHPRDSRADFDAVVFNTSWGTKDCGKLGTYQGPDKHFDRAVHEEGIVVVRSAGNNRDRKDEPLSSVRPDPRDDREESDRRGKLGNDHQPPFRLEQRRPDGR